MAANEALGARPLMVLTLIHHAAMLTSRNGPGDAVAVIDLLRPAANMAEDMDMRRAAAVIEDLQRRAESLRRVAGSATG
jgi:hypothetical protein